MFTTRSLLSALLLSAISCLIRESAGFITKGRFIAPSYRSSRSTVKASSRFSRVIRRAGTSAYSLITSYNETTSAFGFKEQPPSGDAPVLGSITLVGGGPGDPDLLTMAAVKALQKPNALVVADRLISQEILSLVQGELRIANKHPGCAERAQQEIYSWVWEAVSQGQDVVRLKIGDPFLFGRGGEEILQFRQYGVEPKVIPGVSSAFAAPLLSSIAVTHRSVANQVYICTGYGKDGDRPYLAPYYQNQTAVFLMAVGRLSELADNLVQVGYPVTTPVAIVEKASTPQQRTLTGTVATIAAIAEREKAKAPAVVVVGEVVNVLRPPAELQAQEPVVAHYLQGKGIHMPLSQAVAQDSLTRQQADSVSPLRNR